MIKRIVEREKSKICHNKHHKYHIIGINIKGWGHATPQSQSCDPHTVLWPRITKGARGDTLNPFSSSSSFFRWALGGEGCSILKPKDRVLESRKGRVPRSQRPLRVYRVYKNPVWLTQRLSATKHGRYKCTAKYTTRFGRHKPAPQISDKQVYSKVHKTSWVVQVYSKVHRGTQNRFDAPEHRFTVQFKHS